MRLLLALVLLAACGPTYSPQPSLEQRCQGDPLCVAIGQSVEAEQAAEQPVYVQPAPQRVFIHRWLVPGGRNNPAPIGYIDLP